MMRFIEPFTTKRKLLLALARLLVTDPLDSSVTTEYGMVLYRYADGSVSNAWMLDDWNRKLRRHLRSPREPYT